MWLCILIKFSLLKTVDRIMRRHTLMLLILIQTISTVTLSLNILILKVLRLILIFFQNIILAGVGLVATLAVWCSWIEGLAWWVGVHQISFIALIENRTWWFRTSYTLRFLVPKDIGLWERINSRTERTWGPKYLLLLSSLYLRVTDSGRMGSNWI